MQSVQLHGNNKTTCNQHRQQPSNTPETKTPLANPECNIGEPSETFPFSRFNDIKNNVEYLPNSFDEYYDCYPGNVAGWGTPLTSPIN